MQIKFNKKNLSATSYPRRFNLGIIKAGLLAYAYTLKCAFPNFYQWHVALN